MDVPFEILSEIKKYCEVNNIEDVDSFMVKLLKQGFSVEKYGATPYIKPGEKTTEVVEKIVEVPVEKIVEVEKEVIITDDVEIKTLSDKIGVLKKEGSEKDNNILNLNNKITSLENLISEKNNEIAKLKENKTENKDIYEEPKKGFFGSNTMDIYGK